MEASGYTCCYQALCPNRYISVDYLFLGLYFEVCLTVMLEIKTPNDCVFTEISRLIIDSAISLFPFPGGRLFVPMWKMIVAPWHGLTEFANF